MKMVPTKPAMKKSISRFGQGHGGLEVAVQVALRDDGDADQFGVELAAFLADGDHFQHRAGEEVAAIGQAGAQLRAFLDAVNGIGNGIHQNLVADGSAGDVEGLDQRHARVEQGSQHAAESGHGELADQRADDRRAQQQAFPFALAFFRLRPICAPRRRR